MKDKILKFQKEIEQLGLSISEKQMDQFITYYEMLIEKNKVMNLTAIVEFEEVLEKHFLDSVSLIKVMDLNKELKVIDMGTGAGFPGIPLKIMFPNLKVTLADSLNKRILFLKDVIDELKLENCEAIHGRAEELAGNKDFREQYDLCVSRAVANLSTLSEYCLPFVKVGGNFVSYKSGNIDDEVTGAKRAIFLLGGEVKQVEKFSISTQDLGRSFVVIQKKNSTSKKYPRKAGTPSRNPL